MRRRWLPDTARGRVGHQVGDVAVADRLPRPAYVGAAVARVRGSPGSGRRGRPAADAGAPDQERDPVVRRSVASASTWLAPLPPWSAVTTTPVPPALGPAPRSRRRSCRAGGRCARTASRYGRRHEPVRVAGAVGRGEVHERERAVVVAQVAADGRTSAALSRRSRHLSIASRPGALRTARTSSSPRTGAVVPPAAWTDGEDRRDRGVRPPAWTVRGVGRSSFQVTPCPPSAAAIRRPVTMLVWLGRVSVSSRSVRAFSVEAPRRISRCSVGVPSLAEPADRRRVEPVERDHHARW